MRQLTWKPIGAALLATALTACAGDGGTAQHVRQALEQADVSDVAVEVADQGRLVRLTGEVDTLADRRRAEEVAAAVVGTGGRVVNELVVPGITDVPTAAEDEGLAAALERAQQDDAVLRRRPLVFEVSQGVVTVTGRVRTAREKDDVTQLVTGVPGVTAVANQVEVELPR